MAIPSTNYLFQLFVLSHARTRAHTQRFGMWKELTTMFQQNDRMLKSRVCDCFLTLLFPLCLLAPYNHVEDRIAPSSVTCFFIPGTFKKMQKRSREAGGEVTHKTIGLLCWSKRGCSHVQFGRCHGQNNKRMHGTQHPGALNFAQGLFLSVCALGDNSQGAEATRFSSAVLF